MWRPETCWGFSPSSASLRLRSTSHAIREKRMQHRRAATTVGRSFERKGATIGGLFRWAVHGRFDYPVNRLVDFLPRQTEVVGENREGELLSFCSYGVSGKRFDSTQGAGFRKDMGCGIRFLQRSASDPSSPAAVTE